MHFAHPHLIHALLTWGPRLLMLMLVCAFAETELLAADPWHIIQAVDSPEIDLQYPITDPPAPGVNNTGTIDLATPDNVTNEVVYDPVTGQYIMQSTIGDNIQYRPPMSMSLDEYMNYDMQKSMKTYWAQKNQAAAEKAAAVISSMVFWLFLSHVFKTFKSVPCSSRPSANTAPSSSPGATVVQAPCPHSRSPASTTTCSCGTPSAAFP